MFALLIPGICENQKQNKILQETSVQALPSLISFSSISEFPLLLFFFSFWRTSFDSPSSSSDTSYFFAFGRSFFVTLYHYVVSRSAFGIRYHAGLVLRSCSTSNICYGKRRLDLFFQNWNMCRA